MIRSRHVTLLLAVTTSVYAQVIYTVTQWPSICSAIYTSGSTSVTVVQSTMTGTASVQWSESNVNAGAVAFTLLVDQPTPFGSSKRQNSGSYWLQSDGTTTLDGSKAAQYYIQDGQLRSLDGQLISTPFEADNKTMSLSPVTLSISSTFAYIGEALSWSNPAFSNDGMAQFFKLPAALQEGAQVIASFRGSSPVLESWSPVALRPRPIYEAVPSLSSALPYTSVSTTFISDGPATTYGATLSAPLFSFAPTTPVDDSSQTVETAQPATIPSSVDSSAETAPVLSTSTLTDSSMTAPSSYTLSTVTAPGSPIGPIHPTVYPLTTSAQASSSDTLASSLTSSSALSSTSSQSINSAQSSSSAGSPASSSTTLGSPSPLLYTQTSGGGLTLVSSTAQSTSSTSILSNVAYASTSTSVELATGIPLPSTASNTTPSNPPLYSGSSNTPILSTSGQSTSAQASSSQLSTASISSMLVNGPTSVSTSTGLTSLSSTASSTPISSTTSSLLLAYTSSTLPNAISIATSVPTSSVSSSTKPSSSSYSTSSTLMTTVTTRTTTSTAITTSTAPTSSLISSSSTISTSSSSNYLILSSPTPCDFGDPPGSNEDDSFCEVDLPLSMEMYSQSSTATFPSTNGLLCLNQGTSQYQNGPLPYAAIPPSTVLPLMDDMILYGRASPSQGVFYQINNTAVTYEYYLTLLRLPTAIMHFTVGYTFAIPGVFTFTYYSMGNGTNGDTSCVGTQGVDSAGNEVAAQFSYNTPSITPGMVITCDTNQNTCLRTA